MQYLETVTYLRTYMIIIDIQKLLMNNKGKM